MIRWKILKRNNIEIYGIYELNILEDVWHENVYSFNKCACELGFSEDKR